MTDNEIVKRERLKQAIEQLKKNHPGLTNDGIHKALGYKSLTYVSDLIGGFKKLTDFFLTKLQDKYAVNADWIMTGEGSMFVRSVPGSVVSPRFLFAMDIILAKNPELTSSKISKELGYDEDFIDRSIASGKVPSKFIDELVEKFGISGETLWLHDEMPEGFYEEISAAELARESNPASRANNARAYIRKLEAEIIDLKKQVAELTELNKKQSSRLDLLQDARDTLILHLTKATQNMWDLVFKVKPSVGDINEAIKSIKNDPEVEKIIKETGS